MDTFIIDYGINVISCRIKMFCLNYKIFFLTWLYFCIRRCNSIVSVSYCWRCKWSVTSNSICVTYSSRKYCTRSRTWQQCWNAYRMYTQTLATQLHCNGTIWNSRYVIAFHNSSAATCRFQSRYSLNNFITKHIQCMLWSFCVSKKLQ